MSQGCQGRGTCACRAEDAPATPEDGFPDAPIEYRIGDRVLATSESGEGSAEGIIVRVLTSTSYPYVVDHQNADLEDLFCAEELELLGRDESKVEVQIVGDASALEDALRPVGQESVLQEAQSLVYGARNRSYGHPADDYERTAAIWSAILGVEVTAAEAALCMVGVKISRECHSPARDNRVDGAGYFAVVDRIRRREVGLE